MVSTINPSDSCSCDTVVGASRFGGSLPGAASVDECGGDSGVCLAGVTGALPTGFSPRLIRPATACGCLHEHTPILLANSGCKLASELVLGDILVGPDERPQQITDVRSSRQECLELVLEGLTLVCSRTHKIQVSDGKFVDAYALIAGETTLMRASGPPAVILAIRDIGSQNVIDLTCEPTHAYVACDLVHHNKLVSLPEEPLEL